MADETREKLMDLIKEQGEVVRKLKAAKGDNSKAVFGINLKSHLDIINTGLGDMSYVGGWSPSQYDKKLYDICIELLNGEIQNFIHLNRWFNNMKSYEPDEINKFFNYKNNNTTLENIVEKLNSTNFQDHGNIDKKVRQCS